MHLKRLVWPMVNPRPFGGPVLSIHCTTLARASTSLIFHAKRYFRFILGIPCLETGISLFLGHYFFLPQLSPPFGVQSLA